MVHVQSADFKNRIVASAIAAATALVPTPAYSYSPGVINGTFCGPVIEKGTHPLLTRKSVELYNTLHPEHAFTNQEKALMEKGAIEEDSPEFCFVRSFNHFTEMGTGKGIWGFPSSQQWAQSADKQAGSIPFDAMPFGIKQFYQVLVKEKTSGKYPYGNHSWQRAVQDKNLESLGHTLHLIQDATAPAHVRNDAHPGPGGWLLTVEDFDVHSYVHGDSYESWTEDNSKLALLTPKNIPAYTSLDDIFNAVVLFSGSHFFSDDTIGDYSTPAIADLTPVKEGKKTYYYRTIEGEKVPIARKSLLSALMDRTDMSLTKAKFQHKPHYVLDNKVLEAQWKIQGTTAVEMGAAIIALYVKETSGSGCSSHSSKVCSGNTVYWKDSCGKLEEVVKQCLTSQTCENSQCVDTKPTCTPQYSKTCSNGDVYWQDSCGKLGDVAEDCTSGEKCEGGACITQNSQFIDLGDGTVKDTKKGYIWKNSLYYPVYWASADKDCKGYSGGWRLPTQEELKTLYDPFGNKCMLPKVFYSESSCSSNRWTSDKCSGEMGINYVALTFSKSLSPNCLPSSDKCSFTCIKK